MTCRHGPNDPNCSSSAVGQERAYREREAERQAQHAKREAELKARTPDPDRFDIEEIEEVNGHLVLKVKYPNLARCADCSFEGAKVMVILNCTIKQAIKWRRIDPHFKDLKAGVKLAASQAPAPAARFPASADGWNDAISYARGKRPGGYTEGSRK